MRISKQELIEALTLVNSCIGKSILPITSSALIEKESDTMLNIYSTNLKISIKKTIVAKEIGLLQPFCINSVLMLNIIKKIKTDELYFTIDEHLLTIVDGRSKFTIDVLFNEGMNPIKEVFPVFPEYKGTYMLNIEKDLFVNVTTKLYKYVLPLDSYNTHPALNHIFLAIKNKKMSFVGTDSRKMLVVNFDSTGDNTETLIGQDVQNVLKSLPDSNIDILTSEKFNIYKQFNTVVIETKVHNKYVNYELFINYQDFNSSIFNRQEFLNSLEKILLIAKQKNTNSLTLSSNGQILIFELTNYPENHAEITITNGSAFEFSVQIENIETIIKTFVNDELELLTCEGKNMSFIRVPNKTNVLALTTHIVK